MLNKRNKKGCDEMEKGYLGKGFVCICVYMYVHTYKFNLYMCTYTYTFNY